MTGDEGASTGKPPNDAAQLRLLIQSSLDYAIFTLDPQGHVANWNSGARRLKGYEAYEIVGHHFRVFYTEEAQASGHPEKELARAAESGRYEEEGWRVRKDGTQFWANVVITALRAPDGTISGFGKVTRDLTERKQAERTAAIGELAAAVAHELGNPLGVISNAHYLLHKTLVARGDDDLLRHLAIAEREVASAMLIVSDLLDYAESRAPRAAPIYLDELITEALAVAPAPSGVAVVRDDASPGVATSADRQQIRQVLLNAIVNAYEGMPDGGTLTISSEVGDDTVSIRIADTGAGMNAATLERAFDPLFTNKARGLGLGLAVVQRVVDAHGGQTALTSAPGSGTTLTVDLPHRPT